MEWMIDLVRESEVVFEEYYSSSHGRECAIREKEKKKKRLESNDQLVTGSRSMRKVNDEKSKEEKI